MQWKEVMFSKVFTDYKQLKSITSYASPNQTEIYIYIYIYIYILPAQSIWQPTIFLAS